MASQNIRLGPEILATAITAITVALASAGWAATASDFDAAYRAAAQREQQAGALRNQWTPTEAALKAAQKAADMKDYDQAVVLAHQAEALANASIKQAEEQNALWRNAVVK